MENMNENLLHAWLRLSTSIVNSRIVSDLPYNEALVCNALYRNHKKTPDTPLTATDLCSITKMLKSQMNRTLNLLEEKNLIIRRRSDKDKRQIFITINAENFDIYIRQHEQILKFLDGIIERIGIQKTAYVTDALIEISDIADNMLGQ